MGEGDGRERTRLRALVEEMAPLLDGHELFRGLGEAWRKMGKRPGADELGILLLGEGKKGKSSLANALLEEELFPVGRKATTRMPWRVRRGEVTSYALRHRDGHLVAMEKGDDAWEDACRFGGGRTVVAVEATCASPFLDEGRVLEDMPGLDGDDCPADLLDATLERADVILFVSDASYVLTRSEVDALRSEGISWFHDRMILVLNRRDGLDEAEWRDAEAYAREKLGELGLSIPVLAVSARDGDGMAGLRDLCRERLFRRGHRLALDGEFERAGRILAEARRRVDEGLANRRIRAEGTLDLEGARRALASFTEALEREKERVNGTLADLGEELHGSLSSFAHRFRDALADELAEVPVSDVKRYLPFFLRDRFREWVEGRMGWVELRLETLLGELRESLRASGEELRAELGTLDEGGGVDMSFAASTSSYDLGVFALTAASTVALFANLALGGLMTAGTALLALQTKERKDQAAKEEALRVARTTILETAERIGRDFDAALGSFAAGLSESVDERRDALEAQVRMLEADEETREDELRLVAQRLDSALQGLTEIREAMWLREGETRS